MYKCKQTSFVIGCPKISYTWTLHWSCTFSSLTLPTNPSAAVEIHQKHTSLRKLWSNRFSCCLHRCLSRKYSFYMLFKSYIHFSLYVLQSLNCLLIRYAGSNNDLYHSLASFVAGGSFYLYSDTQLLCHALVTAIEQFWENYKTLSITSGTPAIAILSRLPIARIFYPFGFAYLLHVRAFEPWLAPAVLKNLMNLTTNFKWVFLHFNNYYKLYMNS